LAPIAGSKSRRATRPVARGRRDLPIRRSPSGLHSDGGAATRAVAARCATCRQR
jgi:hypothetical protein